MVIRLLTILPLLLPLLATAQDKVEFNAAVNRNVATTDDRILYEITTNQDGRIEYPDFDGFKVIGGPYTQSSSSVSIMNGKMTSKYNITHSIYLRATKTGKLTISPAKMTVGGQSYQTNAIEINISKGSNPVAKEGDKADFSSNARVIARSYVSKSSVYVGEPLVLTYKIYSPFQFYQLINFDKPSHTGFSRNNIDLNLKNNTYEVGRETINGKTYAVITLTKELLIPQEYGKLTIAPFDVEVALVTSNGFFRRTTQESASSNSITVDVKPLPSPQPDNFSGAVGQFSVEAELSKDTLKVNEGLDLKLTVKGNGNIQYMEDPKIDFPSDFEVEMTETEDNVSVSTAGMRGDITFNYFVIPRIHGKFELDKIGISYFDPESRSYKTAKAKGFTVHVQKGDGSTDAEMYRPAGDHKRDVALQKEGIKYLKTDNITIREKGSGIIGSTLWYTGIAVPGLAFLILLLIKRRRSSVDPEEAREKAAAKIVRKHLSTAKGMLESGDTSGYYGECQRALYEYLKDKFHMDMSEISQDQTRAKLLSNGISEETTTLFLKTIERCEMAIYAPMTPSDDKQIYEDCVRVIKNIEKELR